MNATLSPTVPNCDVCGQKVTGGGIQFDQPLDGVGVAHIECVMEEPEGEAGDRP
jgi:hypothetical protein